MICLQQQISHVSNQRLVKNENEIMLAAGVVVVRQNGLVQIIIGALLFFLYWSSLFAVLNVKLLRRMMPVLKKNMLGIATR